MPADTPQLKNILVAVPSTGGVIKSKTAESLFRTAHVLTANGYNPVMLNINNSDVVTVRNTYANMVLNSDRWDALLFIDSDMAFEPDVILRMIKLNVGVAAVACTTRELDLAKFHAAMAKHGDMPLARAEASRFNVLTTFNRKQQATIRVRDGFYSLAAVGMAVCLIRKSALQAMVREGAVDQRIFVRDGVEAESWGFFDQHVLGKILLLEDYSFCYRWTVLTKRPLWVCVDAMVKHLGDFDYGAVYRPIIDKMLKPHPKGNSEADVASAE